MSRRLIITGGRVPREFVLVGTFVVGRDPNCDLSEQDPLLSRRHAEFVESAAEVAVRDLASRNGILINGVKKQQAVLHSGDVVQVGSLQVRFLEDAGPFLEPVPVAAPPARVPPPEEVVAPTVLVPDAIEKTAIVTVTTHNVLEFQEFVGPPGRRFRFDMPARGWRVVAGGSVSIVTLAEEGGAAALVVEWAPSDPEKTSIFSDERFVVSERDILRNQQPEADGIDAQLVTLGSRRLVIVSYSRPGVRGRERARQYSYATGSGVYRLTCTAGASRFADFEDVFAQVAATFETETSS